VFPKQPGVYCFKNTVNNKVYIGSAQCLYTRINMHLKAKYSNRHLQSAIKYYGIDSFCITYQVLETKEQALCLEQMLLDYIFKLSINCYNIADKVSGGCIGTKENHRKLSYTNKGYNAKVRYALEVNSPNKIYTFKSSYEAANFTGVPQGRVPYSCKNAKPYNGSGRWLFSDISIDDLKAKFNNLTKKEIKGINNYYSKGFILINKVTSVSSEIFYSICELQRKNPKINPGQLCNCLLGNRKTVNGYYVTLCI
jgi:group I intron endonuclease